MRWLNTALCFLICWEIQCKFKYQVSDKAPRIKRLMIWINVLNGRWSNWMVFSMVVSHIGLSWWSSLVKSICPKTVQKCQYSCLNSKAIIRLKFTKIPFIFIYKLKDRKSGIFPQRTSTFRWMQTRLICRYNISK